MQIALRASGGGVVYKLDDRMSLDGKRSRDSPSATSLEKSGENGSSNNTSSPAREEETMNVRINSLMSEKASAVANLSLLASMRKPKKNASFDGSSPHNPSHLSKFLEPADKVERIELEDDDDEVEDSAGASTSASYTASEKTANKSLFQSDGSHDTTAETGLNRDNRSAMTSYFANTEVSLYKKDPSYSAGDTESRDGFGRSEDDELAVRRRARRQMRAKKKQDEEEDDDDDVVDDSDRDKNIKKKPSNHNSSDKSNKTQNKVKEDEDEDDDSSMSDSFDEAATESSASRTNTVTTFQEYLPKKSDISTGGSVGNSSASSSIDEEERKRSRRAPSKAAQQQDEAAAAEKSRLDERMILEEEVAMADLQIARLKPKLSPEGHLLILRLELENRERILTAIQVALKKKL